MTPFVILIFPFNIPIANSLQFSHTLWENSEFVPYDVIFFWDKYLNCGDRSWKALNPLVFILCIKALIISCNLLSLKDSVTFKYTNIASIPFLWRLKQEDWNSSLDQSRLSLSKEYKPKQAKISSWRCISVVEYLNNMPAYSRPRLFTLQHLKIHYTCACM